MKILAIGDPHGSENIFKIPIKEIKPDVILITGDLGKADLARKRFFEKLTKTKILDNELLDKKIYLEIHKSTLKILKYLLRYAPVYTLQGNVGIFDGSDVKKYYKKYKKKILSTLDEIKSFNNIHIVKNKTRIIEGLKIGFLEYFLDPCWVEEFKPKDYSKKIKDARRQTKNVKRHLKNFGRLDLLVCHQPPYKILDKVNSPIAPKSWNGKHAGSKVILEYIQKEKPQLVLCGHIHEAKGQKNFGKTLVMNLGYQGDYSVLEFD